MSQFDDGLTHTVIPFGEEGSLKLSFADNKEIVNVTGCFTLYQENQ
jgi:hypothetical protein